MQSLLYALRLTTAFCLSTLSKKSGTGRYIVFNSYKNQTFNFNSKYLFEYLHNRQYRCYFIVNDKQQYKKLRAIYGDAIISTRNVKALRLVLDAPVWVTSTAPPIRLLGFSRNRFVVNLWHGIPLKTVGLLDKNCPFYRKLLIKWLYAKNTDVFCVTSTKLVGLISNSFLIPEANIYTVGHPQSEAVLRNISETLLIEGVPFRVIYCPTYRDDARVRLFPFKDFNLNIFESFLARHNIEITIKMHHCDGSEGYLKNSDRIINFNPEDDMLEKLSRYDAMITDYSSLYFDYLLLDRPIIFLPYDLQEYKTTRGLYFDYESVTPGPKPDTTQSFYISLLEAKNRAEHFANARSSVKDLFYTHPVNPNENIIQLIENSEAWKCRSQRQAS